MFLFHNINISRQRQHDILHIRGEINNPGGKDYSSVALKVVLYGKDTILWSGNLRVRGLKQRSTKTFESALEGSENVLLKDIKRHDIFFEGGY